MAVQRPGIVRMGLVRRLPSLTEDEFSRHWRGPHGALASVMPSLRRYHQNHVIRRFAASGLADRWQLDGLSELWFDSLEDMEQAIASASYSNLARDTPTVMTLPGVIAGTQEASADDASGGAAPHKAMIVAARRDDLSVEKFLDAWREFTAGLVAGRQATALVNTVVTHREGEPGHPVAYEALPIDVVTEAWFESDDALRRGLEEGLDGRTAALAANASLYQVKTHVIVP